MLCKCSCQNNKCCLNSKEELIKKMAHRKMIHIKIKYFAYFQQKQGRSHWGVREPRGWECWPFFNARFCVLVILGNSVGRPGTPTPEPVGWLGDQLYTKKRSVHSITKYFMGFENSSCKKEFQVKQICFSLYLNLWKDAKTRPEKTESQLRTG